MGASFALPNHQPWVRISAFPTFWWHKLSSARQYSALVNLYITKSLEKTRFTTGTSSRHDLSTSVVETFNVKISHESFTSS